MKKICVVLVFLFPLFTYATPSCKIGNIAFYGDLQENSGSQRLCYDKQKNQWIFGVKENSDLSFTEIVVDLDKEFIYSEGDEYVSGYSLILPNNTRVILMKNMINGTIKQGLSIVDQTPIPFINETVVYNQIK